MSLRFTAAAARLDGSILIYNIPAFTNPVAPECIARLAAAAPNIIGAKDSSGSLASLARSRNSGRRFAG